MSTSSAALRGLSVSSVGLITAALLAGCAAPTGGATGQQPEWNTEKSLIEHDWSFASSSLNDDFTGAPGEDRGTASIDFAPDGSVTGSTGCRDFTAEWTTAPVSDDVALGILTSNVEVSDDTCAATDADSIAKARVDAQIVAAVNDPTRIAIDESGFLLMAGGVVSGADAESGYLPDPPVELAFSAPESGDGAWSALDVTDWGTMSENLDETSLQYGPVVGRWFLQRGYNAEVVINPAKLLALDSQPGRRTAWTFDGSTFTTGEGCATISGTIDGAFTHKTSLEVTSLGDCVLDRAPGDRFDYDLEADEIISALMDVKRANANDRVMVLETSMGELVFTRVK